MITKQVKCLIQKNFNIRHILFFKPFFILIYATTYAQKNKNVTLFKIKWGENVTEKARIKSYLIRAKKKLPPFLKFICKHTNCEINLSTATLETPSEIKSCEQVEK